MRRRVILLLAAMGASVLLASGVAYALNVRCDTASDPDTNPGQCQGDHPKQCNQLHCESSFGERSCDDLAHRLFAKDRKIVIDALNFAPQ